MTNVFPTPALETLLVECVSKGVKFIGTRGDVNAPIWNVGEAPGADEDTQGVPFCGPSGRLLDAMLSEAGFALNDCCWTNVYKIRPPYNEIDRLPEHGIALTLFEAQFIEELHRYRPTFIFAHGNTPLSILCPQTIAYDKKGDKKTAAISHWRGSLLTSPKLNWPHYVIPFYHPAFILREWGEKYFNVFLMQKAFAEYEYWKQNGKLQLLTERELIVQPPFSEAWEYLNDILHCTNGASYPCSVDIELLKRRLPFTISLAKSSTSAISLGFGDYGGDDGVRIFRLIDEILAKRHVVGQNYINFDCHWLRACGFSLGVDYVDDTRIRHNVLWPELSHKLEVITMQYTREPYYKEEGKGWSRLGKGGRAQLMKYNCKDTCVTREAYDVQELEFTDRPHLRTVYNRDMRLAATLHRVAYRGFTVDPVELGNLNTEVQAELKATCEKISKLVGSPIAFSASEQKALPGSINIASSQQLVKVLQARKLKVPTDRFSGRFSTSEEKLHQLFAETDDALLKEVLGIRELNKIDSTYVKVKLVNGVMYSDFIVGGTETGRRSSKGFPLGFGCNGQNLPKHSKLGKKFRRAVVARPGKILLSCDQMSAEDWIVQGIIADISGDESGIRDLRSGVDRHCKLAMFIFALPEDKCSKDAEKSGLIFRYVGKRTRHGGHYDMRGNKMSGVLAKEGFSVPSSHCDVLLERFHLAEPNIRGVFHEFVKRSITNDRSLTNLLGRQRYFLGYCPWRDNSEVFRVGYSYIPQGTVGDNTGLCIQYCESKMPGLVLSESHDSVTLEVDDNIDAIFAGVQLLTKGFDRTLTFKHGYQIKIPVEFDLGYNLNPKDGVGLGDQIKDCERLRSKAGLTLTYNTYRQQVSRQNNISTGAPLAVSQQA